MFQKVALLKEVTEGFELRAVSIRGTILDEREWIYEKSSDQAWFHGYVDKSVPGGNYHEKNISRRGGR